MVLLNNRALNALRQAQRLADLRRMDGFKVGLPFKPICTQPSKGRLSINEPSVTIRPFKSALKALDRERRQYGTRHTYATMSLMAGMDPAFIANQLGHSVEMLLSTHAKWISSSDAASAL